MRQKGQIEISSSLSLWALCDLWPSFFGFLIDLRHTVGPPGRVTSPSQGLCLHRTTQYRETKDKHVSYKRASNPQSCVRDSPRGQSKAIELTTGTEQHLLQMFWPTHRVLFGSTLCSWSLKHGDHLGDICLLYNGILNTHIAKLSGFMHCLLISIADNCFEFLSVCLPSVTAALTCSSSTLHSSIPAVCIVWSTQIIHY
jgi:hypothetical protein